MLLVKYLVASKNYRFLRILSKLLHKLDYKIYCNSTLTNIMFNTYLLFILDRKKEIR